MAAILRLSCRSARSDRRTVDPAVRWHRQIDEIAQNLSGVDNRHIIIARHVSSCQICARGERQTDERPENLYGVQCPNHPISGGIPKGNEVDTDLF